MTNQTPNFFKRHKVAITILSLSFVIILSAIIYQIVIWYNNADIDYIKQEIRENNSELIKDYKYIGEIEFMGRWALDDAEDEWQDLKDRAKDRDDEWDRERAIDELKKYNYNFWEYVERNYSGHYYRVYYKNGSYYVLHKGKVGYRELGWFVSDYHSIVKYTHFQVLTKGGYYNDYHYGTHRLGNDYYVRLDSEP